MSNWSDLSYAARSLSRDRGFAAAVVLSLAIGIGANTAIFSIVNGVLLRPLPYPEPARVVAIDEVVPKLAHRYPVVPVNLSHYFDWRQRCSSFENVAAMIPARLNLTGAGEPELLRAAEVSANIFDVFGVKPQLGRFFVEDEERRGRDRVVVLSDSLWRRRFQSDRAIAGRKILLDGEPYTVAGVLPPGFLFPRRTGLGRLSFTPATDIFKPLGYTDRHVKNRFGEFNYAAFARLRPGVGMEKALAELNVVQAAISASLDGDLSVRAAMEPLSDQIVGDVRRGLLVMMGAVGAVLLVLCVNIANLLLARAARRARESAIRTALGAGRGHLVRLVLAESLLLAMGGGLLGMAVAHLGLRLLVHAAPLDLPRLNEVRLDSSVLAFAFLLSLATGLIFGILPALRSAFADPQGMLRAGSHTTTEARHSVRLRGALVAVEAGLSVVLLVAAGLLASSFLRLVNIDKGFNVERVLAVDVSMPSSRYDGEPHREQFFTRLLETVRGLPGVQQASVISALPLEGETWVTIVTHENDPRPIFERPTVNMRFASPDYFKTLEIPLSAGRSFRESDRGRKVAVVSQAVARRLWPDQDPVGRRLVHRAEELLEVVGVTPDIRSTSLDRDPVLMMYVPYWQESRLTGSLLVRTAMEPGAAAAGVRGAIRHIDPEVPVPRMKSMEKVMADSVAQRKFQMLLIVLFAAAALALGCLGIYGVVSYTVARRRTEMGIRMALGASPGSLRTMVVRQGMLPVLSGLGAGLLVVLWAGRVLSSLLFHVSPRDPLILAGVALLLALVSALACLAPAVRATRVDPINVLRYE